MRKHFFLLLTMMVLVAVVPYNTLASELNTTNIDIVGTDYTYTEKQKLGPKDLIGDKKGGAKKHEENWEEFKEKQGNNWKVS